MDNFENNDSNYVEQKIKSKNKRRIKKMLTVSGLSLIAALIFGFVARVVFVVSEGPVNTLLGITPTPTMVVTPTPTPQRSEIKIGDTDTKPTSVESISLRPTATAVPQPTSVAATEPVQPEVTPENITAEPTDAALPTPIEVVLDPTAELPLPTESETDNQGAGDSEPTGTAGSNDGSISNLGTDSEQDEKDTSNSSENASAVEAQTSALAVYMQMMNELKLLAEEASTSLVKVYSITSGINWMDESIETRTERTGVIIADNSIELLILTDYSAVSGADRIELEFSDETVLEGFLFAGDSDLGVAVVAVLLSDIPAETVETYAAVKIGNENELYEGEPVIAIGRPNGYFGALGFGFVTHSGETEYFTDGAKHGFRTDIIASDSSDGIIIDLEGKLIGLVLPGTEGSKTTITATDVDSIISHLELLVNGTDMPYLGVRAENMPKDVLESMGLDNGIYVNEVISASPAYEAGIRKGDVIVGIDGVELDGVEDLYEYILTLSPGTHVVLDIYHSSMREEPAEQVEAVLSVK